MTNVARFPLNRFGKDYVVGDIHGSFDLVLHAMQEVSFDPQQDRLFCLGDLVDRGPNSHCCAEFLSKPYVHSICGNHDAMLLDLYANGTPSDSQLQYAARQYGSWWWLSLTLPERETILSKLSKLPLVIEIETSRGTVGLVHADIPSHMDWQTFVSAVENGDRDAIQTALWGRDRILSNDQRGIIGVGRVFVGHTLQWGGAKRYGNVVAIDTGAVFGDIGIHDDGRLTIANITTKTDSLDRPRKASLTHIHDEAFDCDLPFSHQPTYNPRPFQ